MINADIEVLIDIDSSISGSVDESLLQRAVREALLAADEDGALEQFPALLFDSTSQVGLRITDDEEMRRLNKEYRGVDSATDVLSFSFLEEEAETVPPPGSSLFLGDIAISYPYVERQAIDLGHSISKELAWLTIHGMLQILGYVHDTEDNAQHMEELEQMALAALELPAD